MTRTISMMVVMIGMVAAPLRAQDREPLQDGAARTAVIALAAGQASLQAYDAYSTLAVLERGGVEANPMMRGIARNRTALIAMKAGVTGASLVATAQLWRQHRRRTAIVLLAVTNGAMAVVAAHNSAVLRSMR